MSGSKASTSQGTSESSRSFTCGTAAPSRFQLDLCSSRVVRSNVIGVKSCVVVSSAPCGELSGELSWSLMDMQPILVSHVEMMHGGSHLSLGVRSKVSSFATPVGYRSMPRQVSEWPLLVHDLVSSSRLLGEAANNHRPPCCKTTSTNVYTYKLGHIPEQESIQFPS